jgi:hypothetical protein
VLTVDLSAALWRKATYSNGSGGNCVEVATNLHAVAVRDSKDPQGPHLDFSTRDWHAFVSGLKTSRSAI